MMTAEQIKSWIEEIKQDERLQYPPANYQVNGPLALEQVVLKTKIHTLERILDLPLSKFPTK